MSTRSDVRVVIEPTWRRAAVCRRQSAAHFFAPARPEQKRAREARESVARSMCAVCPVQQACLEYSLAVREPHGIWGGLNERERRWLLRKRVSEQAERAA